MRGEKIQSIQSTSHVKKKKKKKKKKRGRKQEKEKEKNRVIIISPCSLVA
jgi:hypothetical protein